MKRATNGFTRMNIPEFSHQLGLIISNMTGNQHFTSLQTAVQALSTEADIYYVLATKAAMGDKLEIVARNTSRETITTMLHDLGMEVSAVAKGDAGILASSGFPYTQPRKPSPPMEKPAPPKVALGVNNGEIDCKTGKQAGMKSVNYYITQDGAALSAQDSGTWDIVSFNKIKYTFTNLVSGQRYYIKVGLVGVKGQEVISDAVSYIAQ